MKLAIFDLDGTLVDSREAIAEAMAFAFAAQGLEPPSYEETRRIVGLSLEPAVQALLPGAGPAQVAALAEGYKQGFLRQRAEGRTEALYPGADDLVRRLKREGWTLGIATGKARRGVEHFLETHGFAGVFDCGFCADDGPGKPDPHMLRLNLKAARRAAEEAVMIGDTSFDMAMACAAGVHAQGVAWGFHTPQEIAAGGAAHIAHAFEELAAALDAFAAGEVA
ncbi:MAG: HAD-IA family hydrolase [Hyphomonadaceae bacterium]|nr:HAD-IA family hydrolase [Hyphomonadaceae bacterium]